MSTARRVVAAALLTVATAACTQPADPAPADGPVAVPPARVLPTVDDLPDGWTEHTGTPDDWVAALADSCGTNVDLTPFDPFAPAFYSRPYEPDPDPDVLHDELSFRVADGDDAAAVVDQVAGLARCADTRVAFSAAPTPDGYVNVAVVDFTVVSALDLPLPVNYDGRIVAATRGTATALAVSTSVAVGQPPAEPLDPGPLVEQALSRITGAG